MKAIVLEDIPKDKRCTDINIKEGYELFLDLVDGYMVWVYNNEWVCDVASRTEEDYLKIIK